MLSVFFQRFTALRSATRGAFGAINRIDPSRRAILPERQII
jgi:hypothetical protein